MDARAPLVSRPYWAERQTAALFLIAPTSAVWAKSNHGFRPRTFLVERTRGLTGQLISEDLPINSRLLHARA